jgi:hypothetical protein
MPMRATPALLRFPSLLLIAASVALGWGGLEPGSARARTTSAVTSNWAGYAVTGAKYRRVTGSWVVPKGTCTSGSSNASAAWIGLGGFSESSQALEQTGTELDCTSSGRAQYSAWYELVPAASVTIPMKVHAGDKISASVTVVKTQVSLVLSNRTTGKRFAKTLRMPVTPDVTSADWILEAPSVCSGNGNCRILPLTDFGTMQFSNSSATSTGGHTGGPGHSAWTSNMLTLSDGASNGPFTSSAGESAVPSALSSHGSAFSVTFQQGAVKANSQKRTFRRLVR